MPLNMNRWLPTSPFEENPLGVQQPSGILGAIHGAIDPVKALGGYGPTALAAMRPMGTIANPVLPPSPMPLQTPKTYYLTDLGSGKGTMTDNLTGKTKKIDIGRYAVWESDGNTLTNVVQSGNSEDVLRKLYNITGPTLKVRGVK